MPSEIELERMSSRIEANAAKRCAVIYEGAMRRAMVELEPALAELERADAAKSPAYLDDAQVARWRETKKRVILRQHSAAKRLSRAMAAAGAECAVVMRAAMREIYALNRELPDE